jgi:hypothetical protein
LVIVMLSVDVLSICSIAAGGHAMSFHAWFRRALHYQCFYPLYLVRSLLRPLSDPLYDPLCSL